MAKKTIGTLTKSSAAGSLIRKTVAAGMDFSADGGAECSSHVTLEGFSALLGSGVLW